MMKCAGGSLAGAANVHLVDGRTALWQRPSVVSFHVSSANRIAHALRALHRRV